VPRNQEESCQNSAREGNDGYRLLNGKPTSPELLATTVHEFSTKSSHNAATFSIVLPSAASNSVNSAAAANPRNIATTTGQFIKTRIKFKTLELKSLAIF
jgi:hypothetical protein